MAFGRVLTRPTVATHLLDYRGRLSDFVFRVDVRGVAPGLAEAWLAFL